MSAPCIFCKIINKEILSTIIKETDTTLVIQDLQPKAPIHYLIMPKVHIENLSTIAEGHFTYALEMVKMVKKLSLDLPQPSAFNVISNNGSASGQTVFHLHWHFLSGKNIYDGGLTL